MRFYYETWLATKPKPVDFYISSQEQGEQQKIWILVNDSTFLSLQYT